MIDIGGPPAGGAAIGCHASIERTAVPLFLMRTSPRPAKEHST
jgi:hypothetical protein